MHEQIYEAMHLAIEQTLNGESRRHVMDFWLNFVEPFFGLPTRKYEQVLPEQATHRREGGNDSDSDVSEAKNGEHPGYCCYFDNYYGYYYYYIVTVTAISTRASRWLGQSWLAGALCCR